MFVEVHTDWVSGLAWSPDGKTLASCSRDKTVRIWNVQTGQLLHNLKGHTGPVWALAWSPVKASPSPNQQMASHRVM